MKTKEVINEASPSVHENVSSGDRVSGAKPKVCYLLW